MFLKNRNNFIVLFASVIVVAIYAAFGIIFADQPTAAHASAINSTVDGGNNASNSAQSASQRAATLSNKVYWGITAQNQLILSDSEVAGALSDKMGSFDSVSGTSNRPWQSKATSIVSVDIVGTIAPQSTNSWFFQFVNCTSIDLTGLNTSNLTTMNGMFSGCSKLPKIIFPKSFDVSKVTKMRNLFHGCKKLTNLDLSMFNTKSATDMGFMFFDCEELQSLDLSSFYTENVTDMSYMFEFCLNLTSLDICNFYTENVTDMSNMFSDCKNLNTIKTPAVMGTVRMPLPAKFWNATRARDITEIARADAGETIYRHESHTYGDWVTTKEPNCSESGEKQHACMVCAAVETEVVAINRDVHDYEAEYTIDVQPTCTEKGSMSKHCIRCNAKKAETEIASLGHSFGEWETTLEPTCSAKGSRERTCSVCTTVETNSIDKNYLAHSWDEGVITTQPTCTTLGVKTYTCTHNSAHIRKEVADALGHRYSEWKTTKVPTCTEAGSHEKTCSLCYQAVSETIAIDANAHAWDDWTVLKEATCTEKGEKTRVCAHNAVAHKETVEIEALGHDIVSHAAQEVGCTQVGWAAYEDCSRCDYTTYAEIAALGHDFGEWTVGRESTCTEKGEEVRICSRNSAHKETRELAAKGHSWIPESITIIPATCTKEGSMTGTCKVCNATTSEVVPKIAHDTVTHEAKESSCTEIGWDAYETCKNCDYTTYREIPAGHAYTTEFIIVIQPTCTEKGSKYQKCTRCGINSDTIEIAALGHDFGEWTVSKEPTCADKGEEVRVCSRDSAHKETRETEALGHLLVSHEGKAATCTDIGWNAYGVCSDCNYSTYKEIAALGHAYGRWTVVKPSTINEYGEERRVCANDNSHYETKQIEKRVPQLACPDENGGAEDKVVVSQNDGLAPGVELAVEEIAREGYGNYQAIADSVNGEIGHIYDVKLKTGGDSIQPDGILTIKLRIPENMKGKAFKVFHLHGSEATDMEYTVEGNYAVVNTDKLSEFIFVSEKGVVKGGNGLPVGAIAGITIGVIFVVLLAVFIVYFLLYKKGVLKCKSKDRK